MSSTNRGKKRNRQDNYPTPHWCVHRFLETVRLTDGAWIEPCAGDGAIIRAVAECGKKPPFVQWVAVEIRKGKPIQKLDELFLELYRKKTDRVIQADFLTYPLEPDAFDVSISNPPFSLAMKVIERSRQIARHTVMLLRLNFLASAERCRFMQETKPDVYVLPNRPSFVGTGKTDSPEYAWFHWYEGSQGIVRVLNLTPKEERCRPRAVRRRRAA